MKEANAKNGVARILINCAGVGTPKRIVGRDGPMPLGDYEKVIKINLIGTFNVLRLFAADCSKTEPLEAGERGVVDQHGVGRGLSTGRSGRRPIRPPRAAWSA